ncbi:MAG: phage virion morphogenesis protein [Stenotrophomonas maltophilia]|nr:phage virion morphogenesis protein [Stenotrophomonas maltophilia]
MSTAHWWHAYRSLRLSEDLHVLERWLEPLLAGLQPGQRARLARQVGLLLRRGQQRRIAAQRNPDGSPYAPRRRTAPAREKRGRIKRMAMFAKLRQGKHLRVRADPQQVSVGFTGRVSRIARVHQEGRTDAVSPRGPRVRYERRGILGFSADSAERIREAILEHLADDAR